MLMHPSYAPPLRKRESLTTWSHGSTYSSLKRLAVYVFNDRQRAFPQSKWAPHKAPQHPRSYSSYTWHLFILTSTICVPCCLLTTWHCRQHHHHIGQMSESEREHSGRFGPKPELARQALASPRSHSSTRGLLCRETPLALPSHLPYA